MDRLTDLVLIAHLRMRLEFIENYPHLLEQDGMAKSPLYIPRPVELAGMRSRLLRAKQQAKDVAATGAEFDAVLDGIDEANTAIGSHVGDLRDVESDLRSTIEGMLERSNGAPTDGESDGRQSSSGNVTKEAVAKPATDAVPAKPPEAPATVAPGEATAQTVTAAEVEQLTINGVSKA